MRGLATIATAILLLATGAAAATAHPSAHTGGAGNPPDPSITDGTATRHLQAARARWVRHGSRDYSFRVRLSCFCPQQAPSVITVRHGRPVHPPARYAAYATVPRLFAVIAAAIRDRDHLLRVRYDRTTGFPRQISTDPNAMIADEELGITVDRIARIR